MIKITREEVKKVAHLARLELNENEITNHAEQLEKILDYIRQLEKIDTDDVPCTTRAIEVVNAVSYTHLRAHETFANLVCRLLL